MANSVPPHDLDAEKAVIGAVLVSEEAAVSVAGTLSVKDFYSETHRTVYAAAQSLLARGVPVDRVTIGDELGRLDHLERVGGAQFVFSLVESVPTAANASRYAKVVKEKAHLRDLLQAAEQTKAEAMGYVEDAQATIDAAQQRFYDVGRGTGENESLVSLGDLSSQALSDLYELYQAGGGVTGVPTGFRDLDEATSGYQKSELVVLAARPAMGKTALALDTIWSVAHENAVPVALFSLEMSKKQLTHRFVSKISGVPLHRVRKGEILDEEWPRVTAAVTAFNEAPVFVDDTAGLTVPAMRAKLRRLTSRLKSQGKEIGLVVVDYLQLMETPGKSNREQEISAISRALKVVARDLDVPVLAIAQLSRAVEQRGDKRPLLSDLRDSGAIEQDADVAMFLYRDDYYNPDSEDSGVAELIIGKQRQGPTTKLKLAWIASKASFGSLARNVVGRAS